MGWNNNSPGKVWKNLLILGSTTGEAFISPPGDIRAYDVVTGRKVWQFHTIPRPGEFGYETWPKDAHKYVGGANNWGSFSIDDERGIVYVPTGSATYDFYGADRLGENLFANCLIALDARTGKRLWHFQTVHHDLWDYDNVSAPQLVTVRHNGQRVDAVALAGKTGFLYVFNRVTGAPLWPIEERPVPKSDVPGRAGMADATLPDQARALCAAGVHGRRRQPLAGDAGAIPAMRDRVSKARNDGLFTPPALIDTHLDARQSGWIELGHDRRESPEGTGVRRQRQSGRDAQVSKTSRSAGAARAEAAGVHFRLVRRVSAELQQLSRRQPSGRGVPGRASLVGGNRADGRGRHQGDCHRRTRPDAPGVRHHHGEMPALIAYLASTGAIVPAGRGRGGPRRSFRRGPSWRAAAHHSRRLRRAASGRSIRGSAAMRATTSIRTRSRSAGVRYMSDYGVLASWTKPPYTTITAYDINTGEIKWQVPNGDHAPTIAAGGPSNTGGLGARNGLVVTKGGLVFHAGGDGKFRAYDEETGKVLWSAPFVGSAPGVPVSYEAKGRQYVVMIASHGGGRRRFTDPTPAAA